MTSYPNFSALKAHETEHLDYRIRWRHGRSVIAVMAPHGGGMEPGTTEIADALAGHDHAFYSFDGLKARGNRKLHITSRSFDEPVGLQIARKAQTILTIHGCGTKEEIIFIGGLHGALKARLERKIKSAGISIQDHPRYPGKHPENLCNRGRSGMGVQLEVSLGLRRRLFHDLTRLERKGRTPDFDRLLSALQRGLRETMNPPQRDPFAF